MPSPVGHKNSNEHDCDRFLMLVASLSFKVAATTAELILASDKVPRPLVSGFHSVPSRRDFRRV